MKEKFKNNKDKIVVAIILLIVASSIVYLIKPRVSSRSMDKGFEKSMKVVTKNQDNAKYLGYIQIQGLMKKQPILKGTDYATLMNGVGLMETSVPFNSKSGQTILSSHREHKQGFNKLKNIKKGDIVHIHINKDNKDYYFEITSLKVVDNNQGGWSKAWNTKERSQYNELLLTTCYPITTTEKNPKKRFVAYAKPYAKEISKSELIIRDNNSE